MTRRHAQLAMLLEKKGDVSEARAEAQTSVRLKPNVDGLLVLARLDLKQNQLSSADRGKSERRLAMEPGNAAALRLKARDRRAGKRVQNRRHSPLLVILRKEATCSRFRTVLCSFAIVLMGLGFCLSRTASSRFSVDDTIQPISAEYIDRAIEHARQTNADAVLIELQYARRTGRFHARDHRQDSCLRLCRSSSTSLPAAPTRLRRDSSSWSRPTSRRWRREPTPARRIRSRWVARRWMT